MRQRDDADENLDCPHLLQKRGGGGKDTNREQKRSLLREAGHEVVELSPQYDILGIHTFAKKAKLAFGTQLGAKDLQRAGRIIRSTAHTVVHFPTHIPSFSP